MSAPTEWRKATRRAVWQRRGAKSSEHLQVPLWAVIVGKPLFMLHQKNIFVCAFSRAAIALRRGATSKANSYFCMYSCSSDEGDIRSFNGVTFCSTDTFRVPRHLFMDALLVRWHREFSHKRCQIHLCIYLQYSGCRDGCSSKSPVTRRALNSGLWDNYSDVYSQRIMAKKSLL